MKLGGELLKSHYSKISIMRGVEHTVSLFFNYISKIPLVNQIITVHKEIYNLFGSDIYHKLRSIFKPKSYEFHNSNICLFIGSDTKKHAHEKKIIASVSSMEFSTMSLNSKIS